MDSSVKGSSNGTSDSITWQKTKSGKRILELKEVDESIARLLHFAGCTLASLHPEPISTFTSREIEIPENDDDEDEDDEDKVKAKASVAGEEDKEAQFTKFAEAYYTTLNDIQLSLRTSIRHLRLARASPAPLIDPSYGSLLNPNGGKVGVGGFAASSTSKPTMSVAALQLEKDALEDLINALRKKN